MTSVKTETRFLNNSNIKEVNREEIQAAIAKAVELRALHAALVQSNSPSNNSIINNTNFLRFPSPADSLAASHFSAQDYPVFTPSYEDEPLSGYHKNSTRSRTLSEIWNEHGLGGNVIDETVLSDYRTEISPPDSRRGCFPSDSGSHFYPFEDHHHNNKSVPRNPITVLQTNSPSNSDLFSPRRRNNGISMTDSRAGSSCNRCRPATIFSESESQRRACSNSTTIVPLTDSHSSAQSQYKPRGGSVISRLFPRMNKKKKNRNNDEIWTESTDAFEALRRELTEANANRDSSLAEVSEMKSSLGELSRKLESLETYCEELKRALRQQNRTNPNPNLMPVSEEVMVEGLLQMVSEARLSVKHFCKAVAVAEEPAKQKKYELEGTVNSAMYEEFENSVFRKNGARRILDPRKDREAQFGSFVGLRNLSWNEVLRKGTKFYSEELSGFCDDKMSRIISALGWTRPWPEGLLQAFFVAAKCVWLLHLLAFSFDPPVSIMRVDPGCPFDPVYMDDVSPDRDRRGPSRVKVMVVPGFYLRDRVLRCKVLCIYSK